MFQNGVCLPMSLIGTDVTPEIAPLILDEFANTSSAAVRITFWICAPCPEA